MSIEINGAGVITGVDSLSTPAVTNTAGSASAPSITFTGDTNTGIYSPGADQVAISTGGSGRLFVDASGNIGMGTSSLANNVGYTTLYLNGSTGGSLSFKTGDVTKQIIYSTTNTLNYYGGGSDSHIFYCSTEKMRLTPTGLGVGTSSPGALLHLSGQNFSTTAVNNSILLTDADILLNNPQTLSKIDFESKSATNPGIRASIDVRSQQAGNTESDGNIYFLTSSSASPTLTEKLTIRSSGNVGVGTASPGTILDIVGAGNPTLTIRGSDGAYSGFINIQSAGGGSAVVNATGGTNALSFQTNSSERARIDGSGRLLVGTSSARTGFVVPNVGAAIQLEGAGGDFTNQYRSISLTHNINDAPGPNIFLTKTRSSSTGGTSVVASGDELGNVWFCGADGTKLPAGASISAFVDGTPGANDMPGRLVFSTTADGASSPTERMRITNAGNVLINKAVTSASVAGIGLEAVGTVTAVRSSDICYLANRLTTDGSLFDFYQDTNIEGSISVSGSTVSYNGAHLSRWSQIPGIDPHDKDARPEILRGTVMSNLDEMCDWIDPKSGDAQNNEQLNKTKISDVEGDKNVAGIFQSWDDDDDTWMNDYYLAMTGDFIIRIGAGVTVERGDLLMSAGDGTAKPQDDDIIRSKTIAKVTSTNVTCTYEDGSYCVPCVLMAC